MGVLILSFYDKKGERKVSEDERKRLRLLKACQSCSRAFEPDGVRKFTVQHTRTYNGFSLEAWCWQCNVGHAQSVPVELTTDESAFVTRCYERVNSTLPALDCDDEVGWPTRWRGYLITNLVRPT